MAQEQFRSWNPKGTIKVKCTNSDTKEIFYFSISAKELLMKIVEVVDDYDSQGLKLTSRQLFYQLVTKNIIPNAEETYKRICKFLTDARYGGHVDWNMIEDRGRVPHIHADWQSVQDLIESACDQYRLPRWKDQEYYIELYCEKQALEGFLRPIADKYHIHLGANKGYSSASMMYDLSKRIQEKINEGKKAVILYVGDHDASGLDMIRDVRDRITEFLVSGDDAVELINGANEYVFQVIPLALNMEQIKKYNPPPNPAKMTDTRAGWYVAKYGKSSWELDSLRPEVLIQIVEYGILTYLDVEKYSFWINLEAKQKKALEKFGRNLTEGEK